MPGALQIGVWNIHGHKHKELGNKLELNELNTMIRKHDLFGIVETHADESSDLNIESCRHFVKYRNKSGNRNYGGIALYINKRIKDGVSYMPNQNQNVIWCKLNKEHFHTEKDIYLGTQFT